MRLIVRTRRIYEITSNGMLHRDFFASTPPELTLAEQLLIMRVCDRIDCLAHTAHTYTMDNVPNVMRTDEERGSGMASRFIVRKHTSTTTAPDVG